jgi:hypothetical protein
VADSRKDEQWSKIVADLAKISPLLAQAAEDESGDPFTAEQWAKIDETLGRILRNYRYARLYRYTRPSYIVDMATGERTLVDAGGERISEHEWAQGYLDYMGVGVNAPRPGEAQRPDLQPAHADIRRLPHETDDLLVLVAEAHKAGVTGSKRLAPWNEQRRTAGLPVLSWSTLQRRFGAKADKATRARKGETPWTCAVRHAREAGLIAD